MENLIRYCCSKGIKNFETFKFERKSRIVMREHFVSKKDVVKYNLTSYLIIDRYGRYKMPKYFLKQLAQAIQWGKYYFYRGNRRSDIYKTCTSDDIERILLNPSGEVKYILDKIQTSWDKDPVRVRIAKIMKIKNNIKYEKNI